MNESKQVSITIKAKELRLRENEYEGTKKEYPLVHFSDSGMLIDELAYSADQWTSGELDENNIDYPNESLYYVFEHFNFEDALLKATKTLQKFKKLIAALAVDIEEKTTKVAGRSNLQTGAYYALHYPEAWENLLREYKSKAEEERYSFYYSQFLSDYIPELAKELQEAEDDSRASLYKEWLYGDYRDYRGVLVEIAKYYGASEAIDYNDKQADIVTFTFDADDLHEKYCGCYQENGKCGERMTLKKYKAALIDDIYSSSVARRAKEKAANAKRKEERERLQAYKKEQAEKEQAEKAEAERIAKLKKLKK